MSAAIEIDLAGVATAQLAARRARDEIFGADRDGFGEPGWDMLLALFIADAAGSGIAHDDLLADGAVRPAIGRRYVEWLFARELTFASDDGIRLTAGGRNLMTSYLTRTA